MVQVQEIAMAPQKEVRQIVVDMYKSGYIQLQVQEEGRREREREREKRRRNGSQPLTPPIGQTGETFRPSISRNVCLLNSDFRHMRYP
jgi:hypothetical protein